MKKLLILLTIIFGLSSCIPSNEKKAEQMAAKYIKEILYHPESYKPIKTRVDSSYISLDLINETKNLFKLLQIMEEYVSKSNSAERTMEIYAPAGYYNGYEKVEYRKAKQEFERYQRLLKEKTELSIRFIRFIAIKRRIPCSRFACVKPIFTLLSPYSSAYLSILLGRM